MMYSNHQGGAEMIIVSFLRVIYSTQESEAMGQLETVEMENGNGLNLMQMNAM